MRQMIFRRNYYIGIDSLQPKQRLEAYDAIMKYVFDNVRVETSREIAPLIRNIFFSIDVDFEKYEKKYGKQNDKG